MNSRSRSEAHCILAPTDFQLPARRAFMYGVKLAAALQGRLEILHVIKTVSKPPDSRYLRDRKNSALLELGRLARAAGEAGVHAEPRLDYGVPSTCALERAKSGRVEMIVLGTEGRTGWDRLRLGSTALAIFRDAPCPVLAVHGHLVGDVPRHPTRVKLQRLLVGTDFSSCADATLAYVSTLAGPLRASIRLLHAAETEATVPERRDRLLKMAEQMRTRGIDVEAVCLPGNPVETILSEAADWETDVIAVGTHGRQGLSRIMLGSVAEQLLRRAGCPMLIVRNLPPRLRGNDRQGGDRTP